MVGMKINQKLFWIRHCENINNIIVYEDSEPIYLNLFPTNGDSDLIALGEEYIEYMRAKINITQSELFSKGDLIYEVQPVYDDKFDVGNASYRIEAILSTINTSEIRCARLSGSEINA